MMMIATPPNRKGESRVRKRERDSRSIDRDGVLKFGCRGVRLDWIGLGCVCAHEVT